MLGTISSSYYELVIQKSQAISNALFIQLWTAEISFLSCCQGNTLVQTNLGDANRKTAKMRTALQEKVPYR